MTDEEKVKDASELDEPLEMDDVEDLTEYGKIFEADTGDLELSARRALTGLLSKPSVSELGEPELFKLVLKHELELRKNLNNLGLVLAISERYGVAWTSQAPLEGSNPLYVLKRQMRLRRDQTVLLVVLRVRQHAAESQGEQDWFCDADDLVDEVIGQLYRDTKDRARADASVRHAIDELEGMGYLRRVPGVEGRYRIMPVLPASIPLERAVEMAEELKRLTPDAE